jgi:predicted metalloprotease with PDZ domain
VYGRELTVRNNWIEATFAMLNGAPTFLTMHPTRHRHIVDDRHEVFIELPADWHTSSTALMPIEGRRHAYFAHTYDELVDSPIVLGRSVTCEFTSAGTRHVVVFEGDAGRVDVDRVTADVQRIVETAIQMMGARADYPHYYFLNMLVEAGGGLEHANSCIVMAGRLVSRTRRAYVGYLMLLAHEFFHAWHGKRLRPVELGPFDYEREVYTHALWIVEGFTDYYGALLVARAGLATTEEYLGELSSTIEVVQATAGRLVTSAATASFDAWIKQYRPDENTPNTTINYYAKGGAIAFLLDAHMRRSTAGARSLDDVMRLAYQRFSGARGFTIAEFYQTVSDVAGYDMRPWLVHAAESTAELDYSEALDWFGLRFRPPDQRASRSSLGAVTRVDDGRLLVSHVRRNTPAHAAGVNVDDEIVAIDEIRVRPDTFQDRLQQYSPGDVLTLLVARRERLVRIPVEVAPEAARTWRLEPVPQPTAAQRERLASWLSR